MYGLAMIASVPTLNICQILMRCSLTLMVLPTRPAYLHPVTHLLRHDTFTYICMCVCKYTHITAYVMPRADISRCQARKSRPGIAFQTLKLSSIKDVVFRGCVLRLSHNQFRFRFFIRFMCVMEFPTCVYKI